MINKKISIIIPVYNAEKYLNQCLDSIINQTYTNLEIICVNGGSTDSSLNILNEYKKIDERFIIIDTTNEGVSISRNKGLAVMTGDYVMFVDSDDWIDLDNCEKAITQIQESSADVVIWSYVREFKNQSLPKEIFKKDKIVFEDNDLKKLHRRFIGLIDEELKDVENADALCPVWGKLYKTSLIKDNDIQFIDIRKIGTYEDGLFNLLIFYYVKKAIYINEYFYHYRKDNDKSITSQYKENLYENWMYLYDFMEKYIIKNHLSPEYRKALNNRISLGILGQGLNLLESDISHINKIKKINQMITSEKYKEAIKQLSLDNFKIHWKVFYGCSKYHFALGVYILLICIKSRIGKK